MSVEIGGIDSINRLIRPVVPDFGASKEHFRELVSARQSKFRYSNIGNAIGGTANARAVAVIKPLCAERRSHTVSPRIRRNSRYSLPRGASGLTERSVALMAPRIFE